MERDNQKPIRIHQGFWTRDQVAKDVDSVYVFGDNSEDAISCYVPSSTQAVIRSLPNTLGISTKRNRRLEHRSFFSDEDYELFMSYLETKIDILKFKLYEGKTIVFPEQGIGTGKAMLKEKAPLCWKYLCTRLKEEFGYDNGQIL